MKKMRTIIYVVFLLSITLFSCSKSTKTAKVKSGNENNFKEKIENYLNILEKDTTFMGTISIVKKGEEVFSKSIGFRDMSQNLLANKDSKYRIASITKSFTATLVFIAIQEGKITLDETIDSFFPELENASRITIAHLLHHQSGILSYTKDDYFWENREKEQAPEDLLNAIQKLKQNFEPGTNTAYSNSGYFLLGQILEKVYKESYHKLLHKKIIEPLGLNNTYIVHNIQLDKNESFSYVYNKTKWEKFPETNLSLAKAAGSLTSSPEDLNIFFRNLLNGKLISENSLEQMKIIIRRHGMGLFRYKIHDQTGYGHGGNIDGFNSSAIYFKDIDVAIAITSNGTKTSINEVFSKVFELYLGDISHPISEEELAIYEGTYYDIKDNSDTSVFERKNDTLIHVIKDEFRQPLKYKGNRRFLFNQMYGEQITFTFSEDGKEMLFEQGKYKGKYIKKD